MRNHGAVPQVDEEKLRNWRIRIHGQVRKEVSLSLDDLRTKFKTVTIPVTLVCAGNRRKEQNVVRKSLGFSWGAAGGQFTYIFARWLPMQTTSQYRLRCGPVSIFPMSWNMSNQFGLMQDM